MPRITRVAKAQRRYTTVPVLNADGTPKRTPVMVTSRAAGAGGETRRVPKVDKQGRAVTMAVTVADKTRPLPDRVCDKCRQPIAVGSPYKHISPRSGPFGGRTLYRCGTCPDWHVWDYSATLSASLARISFETEHSVSVAEDVDGVTVAMAEAADEVRALAQARRESASNVRDGFGHDTTVSEALDESAEELESWAAEIETMYVPDFPDPEPEECEECEGTGAVDGEVCAECRGGGEVTPDAPTSDQINAWRAEAEACTEEVFAGCPI